MVESMGTSQELVGHGSYRHIVSMLDGISDCNLKVRLYSCICHLLLQEKSMLRPLTWAVPLCTCTILNLRRYTCTSTNHPMMACLSHKVKIFGQVVKLPLPPSPQTRTAVVVHHVRLHWSC